MALIDMFDAVDSRSDGAEELRKALSAGYGTDEATFTGGRALQVEDMELTMINAMKELPEDAKLFNRIKRRPVSSTVHEYNTRDDAGDYENVTAAEGGQAIETNQDINRRTVEIKYLQTLRAVTDQMLAVDSYENALASEKMAGTITILKGAEKLIFHGDSEVVPTEFDGIPKLIKKSRGKTPNIVDLRGKTVGTYGADFFDKISGMIYEAGGWAEAMYFPPVLAKDIQQLAVSDGMRYIGNASFKQQGAEFRSVVDHYTSPHGNTIMFGGNEYGSDKFYRVKGVVSANGNVTKRPASPATVTLAAQSAVAGSQFLAADAGNYLYAVHAVNKFGVSDATAPAAAVPVAANGAVQITITPSATNLETGYIITRSTKGGTQLMEMTRIGKAATGNTVYIDLNASLPGTASALVLTEKRIQPIVEFYQLIPLRYRQLFESDFAGKPFMIQLFGAPDVKSPTYCGLIENIAYSGGLY